MFVEYITYFDKKPHYFCVFLNNLSLLLFSYQIKLKQYENYYNPEHNE